MLLEGAIPHIKPSGLKDKYDSMYVQGAGLVNTKRSYDILKSYKPRVSAFPPSLDFTQEGYAWPHHRMPLYATSMPTIVNVTIMNGMGSYGVMEPPVWVPDPKSEVAAHLAVDFAYDKIVWPWHGVLAVYLHVLPSGAKINGMASGHVEVTVQSPPMPGTRDPPATSTVRIPVRASVIPTPHRSHRVLFDIYHNVQFPPLFIPRDNSHDRGEKYDWFGDHPHTNFHNVFDELIDAGYYVEVSLTVFASASASACVCVCVCV